MNNVYQCVFRRFVLSNVILVTIAIFASGCQKPKRAEPSLKEIINHGYQFTFYGVSLSEIPNTLLGDSGKQLHRPTRKYTREETISILKKTTEFRVGPVPSNVVFDTGLLLHCDRRYLGTDAEPNFRYSTRSGILDSLDYSGNWCIVPEQFRQIVLEGFVNYKQEEKQRRPLSPSSPHIPSLEVKIDGATGKVTRGVKPK